MLIPALKLASNAASGLSAAVGAANKGSDAIIDGLKASENTTVNTIGRVLEGTKSGFLIGYLSPSILTAVGVTLTTGDLLAAIGSGTAILGNPIAGVCAAVGAVYFGWKALNEKERSSILEQVGNFLNVGHELIKSVIDLAIRLMKDLLSAENLREIKETVSDAAEFVGRHLSDITHSVKDRLSEASVATQTAASSLTQFFKGISAKKPTSKDN